MPFGRSASSESRLRGRDAERLGLALPTRSVGTRNKFGVVASDFNDDFASNLRSRVLKLCRSLDGCESVRLNFGTKR